MWIKSEIEELRAGGSALQENAVTTITAFCKMIAEKYKVLAKEQVWESFGSYDEIKSDNWLLCPNFS